jgi:hypothetical protein
MGMVASQQRIASAFVVFCGHYGAVGRHAADTGLSRQGVYYQARRVAEQVEGKKYREEITALRCRLAAAEQQVTLLEQRLSRAIVLDEDRQADFAILGQALGVSLPVCRELLELLIPKRSLSVASLGRHTQAAGVKAGALLKVLDEVTRPKVRAVAADEIYVKDPVLMTVEPESLCWMTGQKSASVSGAVWAEEFRRLPNLEQVTRDGGSSLAKGVALMNAERTAGQRPPLVDQADHYHALREGGTGLRRLEKQACQALQAATAAQEKVTASQRQGQDARGVSRRARLAWQRAEQAMDRWSEMEGVWQRIKAALRLFTAEGELNTRAQAEAVLAETLPRLPANSFAKVQRTLTQAEVLNYLDHVQEKLAALPYAAEIKEAALDQERLQRCPDLLRGEGKEAAILRGILLVSTVILSQAGAVGRQASAAVRNILRRAYRASSLVEGINSVLRMQQARHRKITQGLLDLKRLYWNTHTFRTGRRRTTTPYQRLGVPWPPGRQWLEVLKWTPEQLRNELSSAKMIV